MPIVWDDRLKRNILDIIGALNPRWGRALAAGVEMIDDIRHVPRGGVCVVDDAQLFFNGKKLEAPRGRIHYQFVWSGTISID